jgi:hypothetical protein
MEPLEIFGISVFSSFVAWGLVAAFYIWPWLRDRSRADALRPILLLHSFRFVGLVFLIPGVTSQALPAAFAGPAAYGDLVAAMLAIVAIALLRTAAASAGAWVFNIWGTLDLLYAFYQGLLGIGVDPGDLGAAYFIPTVVVPLLLITHFLAFRILLRPVRAL